MSLAGGWLAAPAALGLACAVLGLLAEQAGGRRVPGPAVPGLGLAVVVAVLGLATVADATAEAAVPLVVALTVGGLAATRPWRDPRLRRAWPWPIVVALGTYAVYALPSLGSGQGSITGYVELDDSAIWLALADHVLVHGRDVSGLAPSSVSATVQAWLGTGYPVGAFLPVGFAAAVAGQDVANAYQPVIGVAAAVLAIGLYGVARAVVASPARAAVCALLGAQASLFFGYAQWGGIKEAVTAALLPALALLAARGHVVALAIVAGGLLGVLGVTGVAWAGPALVAVAVVARPAGRILAAGAAALVLSALPALLEARFVRQATQGAISAQEELGNLVEPLSLLQGAGLWPAGDFRLAPDPRWPAVLLAIAVLVAAAVAVWDGVRGLSAGSAGRVEPPAPGSPAQAAAAPPGVAPAPGPATEPTGAGPSPPRLTPTLAVPLLAAVALPGGLAAVAVGAPWVDAKALAVVSPVVLALAAVCAARHPFALAALAGAVAWSTLLVARDVNVAPRERLAELLDVAPLVAGHGPALVLDFEIYAHRHFLRDGDPEGATDLRVRPVALRDGSAPPGFTTVDVDQVATPDLWVYGALVRRRTPVGSRPPAAFTRVAAGPAFEVWWKAPGAPRPLGRLPLGDALTAAAVPRCRDVAALAGTPGARALAAAPRTPAVVVDLAHAAVPPPWRTADGVRPTTDGTAAATVRLPRPGRWRAWVGGSALGRLGLRAGGVGLGSKRHELAHDGQWLRFGIAPFAAADAGVELRYERGVLPGRGAPGRQPPLGPVALTAAAQDGPGRVVEVPPRRYRRLCDGRAYDWIEALP